MFRGHSFELDGSTCAVSALAPDAADFGQDVLRLRVEQVTSDIVKIDLEGRFDALGAGDVEAQISHISSENSGVIIDLSHVSFIASIGLRILLHATRAVQRHGGRLVLLNPVQGVKKVLDLTGVTDLLSVYSSRADALAAVSRYQ
jgi:anti-anti-sigma factor